MKKIRYFLLFVLLIIVTIVLVNYPRLNIITGFSAKSVCSCTFEADRDLQSIEEGDNDIDPIYYAKNVINKEEKSVTSTVFGLKKRKAIYKEGVGCVLVPEDVKNELLYKPNRNITTNNLPFPYGNLEQKDTVFSNVNYEELQIAIDNAFDKEDEEIKRTRAVLVIYKDQIIGEKYLKDLPKKPNYWVGR